MGLEFSTSEEEPLFWIQSDNRDGGSELLPPSKIARPIRARVRNNRCVGLQHCDLSHCPRDHFDVTLIRLTNEHNLTIVDCLIRERLGPIRLHMIQIDSPDLACMG